VTSAVQALLFDLGGVIIGVDFDRAFAAWSSYSGVPQALIKSRFAFDSCYEAHERGEIGAGEFFDSLRSSLGIRISNQQFLDGWNAILLDEVPGMAALLRRLQTRVPLYLFSNSNATHYAHWSRKLADTLGNFREVFVSCDLGRRKPEPESYAAVSSKIGVALERIRFFDDTEANVQSERNLGMLAFHVASITDIENALADILPARNTSPP
jgi:glucose-1-phosphatase